MDTFIKECQKNGVVNFFPMKCIFTGLPGVGKTSLLRRLQRKKTKTAQSHGREEITIPSTGFQRPVTVTVKEEVSLNEEATTITAAAISKGHWLTTDNIVEQGRLLLQSVKHPAHLCEESTALQSSRIPDSVNKTRKVAPLHHTKPSNNVVSPQANLPNNSSLTTFLKSASKFFRSKSQQLLPAREFMSEVLSSRGMQKLEDLEETTTIYFMDTGGQPEFHELLPPLLRGPALHLIFFNASHDLTLPVEVCFRHEDGGMSLTYKTSSSSIEIVHQLLSSLYCLGLDNGTQRSVSVLLGSHIDLLSTDKEQRLKHIRKISNFILKHIQNTSFYKDGFVTFPTPDGVESSPIFLPLDNVTASEVELEDIQTFLLKVIKERFKPASIPVTWAAFHLILRYHYEQSPGVCTLAECTELAVDCGIQAEDITTVLGYFHENLGTILYYEEVDSLKEFVICNPDVLFSGISRLVTVSFAGSGEKHSAAKKIRETGEIPPHVLPIDTPLTPNCPLTNQHLIDLLTHFKLITHLGDDDDPSLFMPCLLNPDASTLSLLTSEKECIAKVSPPPLLVFFKGAFIPVGVFSALMVELSKKLKLDQTNRYRNRATFIFGLSHIEIRSCLTFIEIRLTGSHAITKSCTSVRKAVVDSVNAALSVQPHISAGTEKCFIGFYCPGCFLPSTPVALHPCEYLCEDDDLNRALLCNNKPRCGGFNESFPVSPEQNVWFEVRIHGHNSIVTFIPILLLYIQDVSSSTSDAILNSDLTHIKPGKYNIY